MKQNSLAYEIPGAVLVLVALIWLAAGFTVPQLVVILPLLAVGGGLAAYGQKLRRADEARAAADVVEEIRRSHQGEA